MRLLRSSFVACAAALVVTGCSKPATPTDEAGIPEAAEPAAVAQPALLEFSLQYALPDASLEAIPLAGEDVPRPLIPPTSLLELRSTPGLKNHRVRLFDEVDRALVSDDAAEESPEGLLYRISLPTPLKPGHKYTLVIDAQTGTSMTDALGREVADVRIPFQIAGDKARQPPPPPAGKRRR
jgi:hypothetical protein